MSEETSEITLTVNGDLITKTVNVRQHLVDFLRLELGLTGSHFCLLYTSPSPRDRG